MPDTTPTLRDRIRRAICEASGFTWLPNELMEPDEYGEHADAVLAVLPAPVDRAAVLRVREYLETRLDQVAVDPAEIFNILIRRLADEAQQPTVAEPDEQDPVRLRWGLDDVMWGDDDSTLVMLSGPDGEPYWLELDSERAAVLRQHLGGPDVARALDAEAQQPETEAAAADQPDTETKAQQPVIGLPPVQPCTDPRHTGAIREQLGCHGPDPATT